MAETGTLPYNPTMRPRFQVGDFVRLIRAGTHVNLVGLVLDVDGSKLVPHYLVEFGSSLRQRLPEFDLAAVPERERSQAC